MKEITKEQIKAFDDRRQECWYLLGDIQKARHVIEMMENDNKDYVINILVEHERKLEQEARELLNRIMKASRKYYMNTNKIKKIW